MSDQSADAQAQDVSAIFTIPDTDSEMEIDEFLDNDEEITIPKYNEIVSSELKQRKIPKSSDVFLFNVSTAGQVENVLKEDVKLHISNRSDIKSKNAENSKDTDSETEINEFLDNDDKIAIPKYNKIDSSDSEPSSSVCHKKGSRNIRKNIKNDQIELQKFSVDKYTNDTSKNAPNFYKNNSGAVIQKTDEKFINYICPQCGKSCKDRLHWKQHTNLKHKFETIDALNMEITTDDSTNWTYKCRDCNFELENPSYSKAFYHRLSHLPFARHCICKICARGFYSRKQLLEHVKSHTGMARNIQTPPNCEKFDYQKHIGLRCPLCLEDQIDERESLLHLETQHDYYNQMKPQITFNSKSLTCNVCNHKLQSREKSYIIEHMILHEPHKAYTCELCNNYEGSSRRNVISHIHKTHCIKGRKLKCNLCNLTFNYNRARVRHYEEKHKVKEHACKTCHKYFANVHTLLAHMKTSKHH